MAYRKTYRESVQGAYLAYDQRPADAAGEICRDQQPDNAGGNLSAIVAALGNSAESVSSGDCAGDSAAANGRYIIDAGTVIITRPTGAGRRYTEKNRRTMNG